MMTTFGGCHDAKVKNQPQPRDYCEFSKKARRGLKRFQTGVQGWIEQGLRYMPATEVSWLHRRTDVLELRRAAPGWASVSPSEQFAAFTLCLQRLII